MKIVHISENYIDGWGYQENLLPLYQKKAGDNVVVISDNEHIQYAKNKELAASIIQKGNAYEHDGIKVYKIKTYINTSSTSFFCIGLFKLLVREKPDMIFHHNVNCSTLSVAARYKRQHPQVKLYADNHVDWINESKNTIWHRFFYDTLIPWQVRRLGNDVDFYIGVSPLRCKYLKEVFRVPEKQIRFLPIGCDTMGAEKITLNREELRRKYGLEIDNLVVVSGGKLDKSKGTITLIEACEKLRKKIPHLRLVLFGKIDEEVKQAAETKTWLMMKGWCDRETTLSLLKMADIACWPWLHTTLIEDSVSVGTPLLVKMSDNVSHFAQEKAGYFLAKGDTEELIQGIQAIKDNMDNYKMCVQSAKEKFSYASLIKHLADESFCNLP